MRKEQFCTVEERNGDTYSMLLATKNNLHELLVKVLSVDYQPEELPTDEYPGCPAYTEVEWVVTSCKPKMEGDNFDSINDILISYITNIDPFTS